MFLCALLKTNGSKIALIVWSLSSMDGMLMIYLYFFPSLDQAEKFKKYLSSKHPNINFSLQKKNHGRLSFLYINMFCEKWKFVTNVYRKKTFSGIYTNFINFIPENYKTGLAKSLLFRCFKLCSDFVKFHHKINILKSILHKKSYPRDFVDKCIKEILDRVLLRNVVVSTVPKKDLMIVLPYLAKFFTSNSN